MTLLQKLYRDEAGYILSAEAALLGTVGVVGATVGLGAVSNSLNDELKEVAYAFRSLDQSYCIEGQSGCGAWTAGSCFTQQEVEVSHAELGELIEEQRQDDGDEGRPRPQINADEEEISTTRRLQFERRREEHESEMRQRERQQGEQAIDPDTEQEKPASEQELTIRKRSRNQDDS